MYRTRTSRVWGIRNATGNGGIRSLWAAIDRGGIDQRPAEGEWAAVAVADLDAQQSFADGRAAGGEESGFEKDGPEAPDRQPHEEERISRSAEDRADQENERQQDAPVV